MISTWSARDCSNLSFTAIAMQQVDLDDRHTASRPQADRKCGSPGNPHARHTRYGPTWLSCPLAWTWAQPTAHVARTKFNIVILKSAPPRWLYSISDHHHHLQEWQVRALKLWKAWYMCTCVYALSMPSRALYLARL